MGVMAKINLNKLFSNDGIQITLDELQLCYMRTIKLIAGHNLYMHNKDDLAMRNRACSIGGKAQVFAGLVAHHNIFQTRLINRHDATI